VFSYISVLPISVFAYLDSVRWTTIVRGSRSTLECVLLCSLDYSLYYTPEQQQTQRSKENTFYIQLTPYSLYYTPEQQQTQRSWLTVPRHPSVHLRPSSRSAGGKKKGGKHN
jgi:hypothetical protein